MSRRARLLLGGVLVLAMGLLPCTGAQAAYDPLGSGTTTLTFAKPFRALLARNHVKVEAVAGAKHKGAAIVLPASGGEFEPVLGLGTVENDGRIVFSAGRRRVVFRSIVLKAKRAPLYAKVGGGQLKIASSARLTAKRSGFGIAFSASGLRLTAKVATRLDKKLGLGKALAAGQPFGTITAKVMPLTTEILPQGRATLQLAPEFVAKLDGLFVAANPIFPAEHQGATYTLPILPGGSISPRASLGTLKTAGSIEFLQLPGNNQVFWHEFWFELGPALASPELDTEPSPPRGGKAGRVPVAVLGPGAVSADSRARTISVAAAPLALEPATATLFNEAFAEGKAVFSGGEAFATITFTAQAH